MSFLPITPSFQPKIWGGTLSIPGFFTENIGEASIYGPDLHMDTSPFQGLSLLELWQIHPEFWGIAAKNPFSIFCKWIAASDDLSVQVHLPQAHEWWLVCHREKNAKLFAGFQKNISYKQMLKQLKLYPQRDCLPFLESFTLEPMESIFIPGSTIHSIGKGHIILEIKNKQGPTFRLWDKKRTGPKRPLQIKEALDIMDRNQTAIVKRAQRLSHPNPGLLSTHQTKYQLDFFTTTIYHLRNQTKPISIALQTYGLCIPTDKTCQYLSKSGRMKKVSPFHIYFVPAGNYQVAGKGDMMIICPII